MARSWAMRWRPCTPGKVREDLFLAPPGTKVGLLFPGPGSSKAEGGFDTFTVVGLFQERDERIRLDPCVCAAGALAGPAAPARCSRPRRGQPDPDQGQARRQP